MTETVKFAPSLRALTTTPSMRASSAELTVPVSAAAPWARTVCDPTKESAIADPTSNTAAIFFMAASPGLPRCGWSGRGGTGGRLRGVLPAFVLDIVILIELADRPGAERGEIGCRFRPLV